MRIPIFIQVSDKGTHVAIGHIVAIKGYEAPTEPGCKILLSGGQVVHADGACGDVLEWVEQALEDERALKNRI